MLDLFIGLARLCSAMNEHRTIRELLLSLEMKHWLAWFEERQAKVAIHEELMYPIQEGLLEHAKHNEHKDRVSTLWLVISGGNGVWMVELIALLSGQLGRAAVDVNQELWITRGRVTTKSDLHHTCPIKDSKPLCLSCGLDHQAMM